jgi:hypothetical protein
MNENKTGKYFKYAIGEIILVVIGILIALSINNWNENRKEKNYEKQVYGQIYNDIISDSLNLLKVIESYSDRDTLMNRVLYDSVPSIAYDTITNENQRNFPYGVFLITNYRRVINTKKGYQLFKTFNTSVTETDSLSFYVEAYYSLALDFENYSESLPTITKSNIQEFQQKDWYLDLVLKRRLNPNYLEYIRNSDDFKTRIYDYQLFTIRNYIRGLKEQQESAEKLKEIFKNRLEK